MAVQVPRGPVGSLFAVGLWHVWWLGGRLGTKAAETKVARAGHHRSHAEEPGQGTAVCPKGLSEPVQSEVSPEEETGLVAEAAAQASAVFPALGAGCCGPAQGSEPFGPECVLAPVGTPHGSTEAAGLAPVEGRVGSATSSESSGQLG